MPSALLDLLNEENTLSLAQDALYLLSRLIQDTLVARQLGQRGVVAWLTVGYGLLVSPGIAVLTCPVIISLDGCHERLRASGRD